MPLFKNVSGQFLPVFAYNSSGPVTGDAANISGSLSKNGLSPSPIAAGAPTEIGGGWYGFPITQAESNADVLVWYASSTTSGVTVEGGCAFTFEGAGGLPSVNLETVQGTPIDSSPTLESSLPFGTVTGTPTTTTTQLVGSTLSSADGAYAPTTNKRFYLWPTSGPNAGLPVLISAYNGSTKTFTHAALPSAMSTGNNVKIVVQLLAS